MLQKLRNPSQVKGCNSCKPENKEIPGKKANKRKPFSITCDVILKDIILSPNDRILLLFIMYKTELGPFLTSKAGPLGLVFWASRENASVRES